MKTSYVEARGSALYTTRSGRTLGAALDEIARERGSAVGVWHVVMPDDQLIFAAERQARRAVAGYLLCARRIERLTHGSGRVVHRLNPAPKLRDGASGRSYRRRAAGITWSVPRGCGYVRIYERTQEMERGRAAEGKRP